MTKRTELDALDAFLRNDLEEAHRIIDRLDEREAFALSLAASQLERAATHRAHAVRRGVA